MDRQRGKPKSPAYICSISNVYVELIHMSKLDPKSRRCIFIGYKTGEYDYRFWDLENRKILRHKDMIFNK